MFLLTFLVLAVFGVLSTYSKIVGRAVLEIASKLRTILPIVAAPELTRWGF